MSRTKIVAGVAALALAGGTVVALWDEMPWAGDERECATASAAVRTDVPLPAEPASLHPMISPDGKHLLYPSNQPVLVETGTGKKVRAYDGDLPWAASFRADGAAFVTVQRFQNDAGQAIGAALWDVTKDKAVQVFPVTEPFVARDKQRGQARDVAVSPDGRLVAISTEDDAVRLWNVRTGTIAATLRDEIDIEHTISQFQTSSLAFSPDGELLALGDDEGKVLVWRVGTRQFEAEFTAPGSGSIELAFSPDGKYLAVREFGQSQPSDNQDVWVVELAAKRSVQVPYRAYDPVRGMRFSAGSDAIVTVTLRGIVSRTSLADGTTTALVEVCGSDMIMINGDATAAVSMVPVADRSVYELATYPLP